MKEKLENLRQEKLKGIMMRAKVKWIEEGEKPTKYFCSLEKRNYVNKTIYRIKDKEGKLVCDQKKILEEIENYYNKLYTSIDDELIDVNLDEILSNSEIPTLSSTQADTLEGIISIKEAGAALYKMRNNKSPGTDGYSSEFYKFFWKDLGIFF